MASEILSFINFKSNAEKSADLYLIF